MSYSQPNASSAAGAWFRCLMRARGAPEKSGVARHGAAQLDMGHCATADTTGANDTIRHDVARGKMSESGLLTSGFGVRVPGGAPIILRCLLSLTCAFA
jgi:hypothetical protein